MLVAIPTWRRANITVAYTWVIMLLNVYTDWMYKEAPPQSGPLVTVPRLSVNSAHNVIVTCSEWMNENTRILSAFENRLRAGFV